MIFTYRFFPAAELANPVRLVRSDKTWGVGALAMAWNAGIGAYEVDIDTTDAAEFDAALLYALMTDLGATTTLDNLMIGDGKAGSDLLTHVALTIAHGATGAVVGTTNAQTLTNKTMDGDDNSFSDIPQNALSAGSLAEPIDKPVLKGGGATDAHIFIDAASSGVAPIHAKEDDGITDARLDLYGLSVHIADKAGDPVKLTGVLTADAATDAVTFAQHDALDTRVAALERADAFSGTPAVAVAISNFTGRMGRRLGGNRETFLSIDFRMDGATNEAAIKRYEVYWTQGAFGRAIAAGVITTADLEWLRTTQGIAKEVMKWAEGNQLTIPVLLQTQAVCVVAFDWAGVQYVSAQTSHVPVDATSGGGLVEDNNTIWLEFESTIYRPEKVAPLATAGSAVAAWLEYLETSTTPVEKVRTAFEFATGFCTFKVNAIGKVASGAGNYANLAYSITNAVTDVEMGAGAITFDGSDYEEKHLSIDVANISLVAGTMYNITLTLAAGGAYNAYVQENIIIKGVKRVSTTL